MLETKSYSYPEIVAELGTKDRQGIKSKLENYGITYAITGRGGKAVYTILEIPDPFKAFCITELHIPANAGFERLKYCYYYFFNDETFAGMPRHYQANFLADNVFYVCRQTVSNWINYLIKADYFDISDSNCKYYIVSHGQGGRKILSETTKDIYLAGWRKYWQIRGELPKESSGYAWKEAMKIWGGCAYKHRLPEENGIYIDKINELAGILKDSVSDDLLSGRFVQLYIDETEE